MAQIQFFPELLAPGWLPLVLEGPRPLGILLTCQQHRLSLCPSPAAAPSFASSPGHLLTLPPLCHNLPRVPELVPFPWQKVNSSQPSPFHFWPVPHCSHLVYKIKRIFFFPVDLIPPGVSDSLRPKSEQEFPSTLRM